MVGIYGVVDLFDEEAIAAAMLHFREIVKRIKRKGMEILLTDDQWINRQFLWELDTHRVTVMYPEDKSPPTGHNVYYTKDSLKTMQELSEYMVVIGHALPEKLKKRKVLFINTTTGDEHWLK